MQHTTYIHTHTYNIHTQTNKHTHTQLQIHEIEAGSSAAASGQIAPGDILHSVNNIPVATLSREEAEALLNGAPVLIYIFFIFIFLLMLSGNPNKGYLGTGVLLFFPFLFALHQGSSCTLEIYSDDPGVRREAGVGASRVVVGWGEREERKNFL